MKRFGLGIAGGGNVGIAFNANTIINIEPYLSETEIPIIDCNWHDSRVILIRHVIMKWHTLYSIRAGYKVKVIRVNNKHIGFASSASIQIATWAALNGLYGFPFSESSLRKVIAEHYCEADENDNNNVTKGFTTGLSSFLGLYGGYAVVGMDTQPETHIQVPSWSVAMVTLPGIKNISFGDVEVAALTTKGPILDSEAKLDKQRIIYDELTPAVEGQDLPSIGRAVEHIQNIGSKLAEIEIYGDKMFTALKTLRRVFDCVYMSAVGPGIVVISTETGKELKIKLEALGFIIEWAGTTNNTGMHLLFNKQGSEI